MKILQSGNNRVVIIVVSLAIMSLAIFFSFTGFEARLQTNDVVSNEQVFVGTNQVAIDNILKLLEQENMVVENNTDVIKNNMNQAFGIGIFVDFKDSNGKIIPQDTNFLNIPFTEQYVNVQPASLIGTDGELLDFAKIQFDVVGVVVKDTKLQVKAEYEILSNGVVFQKGTIFKTGVTVDKKLELDFEQNTNKGQALELSFEKNEIPYKTGETVPFLNTLEFRITLVDVILGEGFETDRYFWKDTFPVYVLKFDADSKTRTVRDYKGVAIQTLPNDVGIQVCGYDSGRVVQSQDFGRYAPNIQVKTITGTNVITSIQPVWGSRDADFNSLKCGNISSGLERNTDYQFVIDGNTILNIKTPATSFLYKATCTYQVSNGQTIFPCTSNFGWSR